MRQRTVIAGIICLFLLFFFPARSVQWVGLFGTVTIWLSGFWAVRNQRSIQAQRLDPQVMTYRFQDAQVALRFVNDGILPAPYLYVNDHRPSFLASSDASRAVFSLPGGAECSLRYTVRSTNRGLFRVGPVEIGGSDPLGLFPWRKEIHTFTDIIVYPATHDVRLNITHGLPAGALRTWNPIYEDVTQYRSVREYINGDDTRRINWKVSARRGTLHTTEYLPSLSFPVLILLNLRSEDFQLKQRYHITERTIEAAASLVRYAVEIGQDVGLVTNGEVPGWEDRIAAFPLNAGTAHGMEIMAMLAQVEITQGRGGVFELLQTAGHIPYGTRVMYIGPELTVEEVRTLTTHVRGGTTIELFYMSGAEKSETGFVPEGIAVHRIAPYGEISFDRT